MAYLGTPIDTQNQFQSLQGKRFSGDASTTGFTLDIAPSSVFDIEVFVENVRQDPNSAYSLSGTTLTFAAAPPSGTNNIYVIHQAKAVGTIEVLDSAITTAKLGADAVTEAKIADDAVESEHLNDNIISGQTELASEPADTDEFLVSDAGTLKRIDYSLIKGGGGKILQVKQAVKSDISTLTGTGSYQDISGLSVSITPSATSSKILVQCLLSLGTTTNTYAQAQFVRDSTAINLGDTSGSRPRGTFSLSDGGSGAYYYTVSRGANFLDSPNSTSALTYKVQALSGSGVTLTFNTSGEGHSGSHAVTSSITVMEIGE